MKRGRKPRKEFSKVFVNLATRESVLNKKSRTDVFGRSLLTIKAVIFFLVFSLTVITYVYSEKTPLAGRDAYVSSGIGDARVLIPFLSDDVTSSTICSFIYNGLTKPDKNLDVIGDLAEKWEISEEGLVITFYLRRNVKWHDGMPFTAEDVRFTFNTIRNPDMGCPYISGYMDISEIEVIDPYTVRFRYARPYAPALRKLGMGIIPEHIFKDIKDIRSSSYARAPVGTGPYRFSRWESGQYIVLEANNDYFEHAPGIKRYVYKVIPDQSVQFLELVSGGIDSMQLNPYQYIYRSETERFEKNMKKYRYLSHSYTYIGYNLKDPLLNDVRVRQALSHAINKKEIIDAVLLGLGAECTGPFLKGTPYYDESIKDYEYDPVKAIRLLKEAGWEDIDSDGVLEKDGREFRISLVTNQGNQAREDTATIVQSQWAEVGVKTDIKVIAWAAFLDQFITKKNFQTVMLGWTTPADPDCYAVWHTDSITMGGLNFISYSNKQLDSLIEQGRREFDPDERAEIYRKIHGYIQGDAPYTFLFFPYDTPAVERRFHGIEPAPAGISYNFIDWYVPEDEVKYKF